MSAGELVTQMLVRFGSEATPNGALPIASCACIASYAYLEGGPVRSGDLVVEVGISPPPGEAQFSVKVTDAEVSWSPGHAWMRSSIETAHALLSGLARFAMIENELRQLEAETSSAWTELEEDRPIAFEAKPADLKRSHILATRVAAAFGRRIHFARLESCLSAGDSGMTAAAAKLAEKLCEAADQEARSEVLDGQMEVFEHIYEMASQRLGEFRASHHGNRVEWIIVALLAIEIILMLAAAWGRGIMR